MTCECPQTPNITRALHTLPDGVDGTRETLKHMRELVRASKTDIALRHFAQTLTASVLPKNWLGELAAVFAFVRRYIRYALDVNGIEVIQDAQRTLALGYGDCDDMVILIASLCELLGHPCLLCAMAFDHAPAFSHVVVLVSGGAELPLICLDATENRPMGWFPPNPTALLIAEIEGSNPS